MRGEAMLKSKHFLTISTLIIALILLLSIQTLAQYETQIVSTINYFQLREFQLGDIPGIANMKISANGTTIVFSSGDKTIWTTNTDGSNLVKVFDYADFRTGSPYISPHIDISADGSKIIWTDGVGEIFVANSDGSGRLRIAAEIPTATGVVGPGFPLSPRITADGSHVYFMNTNGGPDVAGGYKVNANGSGLTKLFSYRQMATQLFGMSGDEYNGNIAFRQHLDISDNGSHLIFGTFSNQPAGHTIAVNGSSLRILFDYAPASIVGLAISGDGKKVVLAANKFSGRTSIFSMDFGGSNQIEIFENAGQSPIFGRMTTDGSHVIAQSGNLPITLLRTDGNGRLDLVASPYVTIQGKNPFFRAGVGNTISITPDGKRFCFPTVKEFGFSWQSQIWIADINPDSPGGAPAISDVSMSPGYVLNNGGSTSTFKAWSANNLESMTFDGFSGGAYKDIMPAKHLYDNGVNGDATANDGLYTYNAVRSYNIPDPGAFSVRFVAAIRQHVTAVDALPFFILNQAPSGSPPAITSINPSSGEPGSQITITGSGFNQVANQNIVLIGNRQAIVISATPSQLVIEIPTGLPTGAYTITVSTNGQISNAGSINVGGSTALNPPLNLKTDIFENHVLLSWDPPLPQMILNTIGQQQENSSQNPGLSNLLSYNIYRATSPNPRTSGSLIDNVPASGPSYFDASLTHNIYYYQVTAVYDVGESGPSNEAYAVLVNVKENSSVNLPDEFALKQNYPNPSNPTTTIEFTIPVSVKSQQVKLAVYNLLGEEIKTLVDKKYNPGFYSVLWDGKNNVGSLVPSGLYVCRLQAGSFYEMRKMILAR
jgi:hypothetical protein